MSEAGRENPHARLSAASTALIGALAQALRVELRLRDADGRLIFESAQAHPPALDEGRAPLGRWEVSEERPGLEPLLSALGRQIAQAEARERDLDRLTEQLGQAYDEINLLYRFTRLLHPGQGLEESVAALAAETAELVDPRLLAVSFAGATPLGWHSPLDPRRPQALRWLTHAPENLSAVQAEFARHTVPSDASHDRCPGTLLTPHGWIDYMLVPVRARAEVSGFVGLFRVEEEPPFETGEVRILECLAKEVSNAATQRSLNDELGEMLFNTVRGLVAAIDAKDEYTRGHSQRVYHISLLLARRLALPPERIQIVSWAALLHDIGKIAIDRVVLNKPSRLTDDEYRQIQTHPARGCRVLEPIPQLREAMPGIRHHHERWDGRGYPDGLAGEEIPLEARVIGIADAYDAIVSTRAYREARPADFALGEIARGAGTQFDPALVPLFLQLAADGELEALTPQAAEGRLAA